VSQELDFSEIKGFLFDLDGVMYVGGEAIPGAADTISYLKSLSIPVRFCTNTTVLSNKSMQAKLAKLGLPVDSSEFFGSISAAVAYLRSQGNPRCRLLLTEDPRTDFAEFVEDEDNPEILVVGDVCKAWSYDLLHSAFLNIMDGAEMVALHKGRYWQTETGLQMDIGAFVAGLEYVTSTEARIIGKPSPDFFRLALHDMGLQPHEVAMVGDDIISDIGGAQAVGMKGIMVRTGKYREETVARAPVTPDSVIDSVADLQTLITR